MRTASLLTLPALLALGAPARADAPIALDERAANPTFWHGQSHATIDPKTLAVPFENHCAAGQTTTAPLLRVHVDRKIKARFRITAHEGSFAKLLVFTANHQQLWCSDEGSTMERYASATVANDWEPGDYDLRVVTGRRDQPKAATVPDSVDVSIEYPQRAQTFADVRVEKLDAAPASPLIVGGTLQPGRLPGLGQNCSARFPDSPDLVLDIGRPLHDLEVTLLPAAPGMQLQIKGPLPDGRLFDDLVTCDAGHWLPRPEGRYAIYIGGVDAKARGEYVLVVRSSSTGRDPLARSPLAVPSDLPAKERVLTRVFFDLAPEQVEQATRAGEELREALFAAAPRALWVSPRLDVDAEIGGELRTATRVTTPRSGAFAHKDEPLLIYALHEAPGNNGVDASVLAADGSFGTVRLKYLVDAPKDALHWPEEPRGIDVDLDTAKAYAVESDRPDIDRYAAQEKKFFDCYQRQFQGAAAATHGTRLDRAVHELKGDSTEAVAGSMNAAAEKNCKPNTAALHVLAEKLRKDLVARRLARQTEMLARTRAKLAP